MTRRPRRPERLAHKLGRAPAGRPTPGRVRAGRPAPKAPARGAVLLWPLPALLAWGCGWLLLLLLLRTGWSVAAAAGSALFVVLLLARLGDSPWRRRFIFWGFPLSVALAVWSAGDAGLAQLSGGGGGSGGSSGGGSVVTATPAGLDSAWWWLLGAAALAVVYPVRRWQDAPWYPTPRGALQALSAHAPLGLDDPKGSRVLDAGCGTGAGLRALREAYPQAELHGVEWSWPLVLWCRWRCRFATVRRGDFWRDDWAPYALVYVFARPESMARAAAKAATELRPGAWLVSLDFEATEWQAQHRLQTKDGRALWLYQQPLQGHQTPLEPTP